MIGEARGLLGAYKSVSGEDIFKVWASHWLLAKLVRIDHCRNRPFPQSDTRYLDLRREGAWYKVYMMSKAYTC